MLYADTSRKALQGWLTARGDGLYPLASEFGPFEMRPYLPYTAMFRRVEDGTYRITLVGTALVEVFGDDATGREVKSIYPEEMHELLEAYYDALFANHYLAHSLRIFEAGNGAEELLEQVLMPIGNADGEHDRYMVLMNRLPMPEVALDSPRPDLLVGDLLRRTVYDARTLLPVDSDLSTPRNPEEMLIPLIDLDTPADLAV